MKGFWHALSRKARSNGRGMTVMEVLIAVIILAVLASLAVPSFLKAVEKSKDKEAHAILRLIRTAERIYRMKFQLYYPDGTTESDVNAINQVLRLNIDPEQNWDYEVESTPSGFNDFVAKATRNSPPPGPYNRRWEIRKDGNLTEITL